MDREPTQGGQAYIGVIESIDPIKGADRIEYTSVNCGDGGLWGGVVRKGDFKNGDVVEVYLMDSIVPQDDPRFDFLGSKKAKPIRMARLRGMPSEVLVMPLSDKLSGSKAGRDITIETGTLKYEKPVPMTRGGNVLDEMPWYIPRTDEPNFQKVPELVNALRGQRFIATEKADGTSTTAFMCDGELFVCSRRYIVSPPSPHWAAAKKYNVAQALSKLGGSLALQWETVGPGIQKNPMGLSQQEMRLFDIYDFEQHEYLHPIAVQSIANEHGLQAAKVISINEIFDMNNDDLRMYAEGVYDNGHQREGVVIRPLVNQRVGNERLSFKVINLLYGG